MFRRGHVNLLELHHDLANDVIAGVAVEAEDDEVESQGLKVWQFNKIERFRDYNSIFPQLRQIEIKSERLRELNIFVPKTAVNLRKIDGMLKADLHFSYYGSKLVHFKAQINIFYV